MNTQVKQPEPISIPQIGSEVAFDPHLPPHDILDDVDASDEANAFGNFIVFVSGKENGRAEISMRAIDEHAANYNWILLDLELSDKIKHVLRAQDMFCRAQTSLCVKERVHLAFTHQLKAQIAHRQSLLQDEASLASPARHCSNELGNDQIAQGLNGAASTQQADLLILKLSLVNSQARRDALASLLERQREELGSQQIVVQACLAEAFKSANLDLLKQQAPQQLSTVSRESDFALRYRTLCKQLGINGESGVVL